MSLFRTQKMLNVRFPHFLLSALFPHGCNSPKTTSRNLIASVP
jgi:hypothetical protein